MNPIYQYANMALYMDGNNDKFHVYVLSTPHP